MLKKINRISKQSDFELIKKEGEMFSSPLFGMLVIKDNQEKQFGFIISKKISKRAVDRNRIKRYLAESLRINLDKIKGNFKIVFLAKKLVLGATEEEIRKEVERCLEKLS